jgi:hypothetical protein
MHNQIEGALLWPSKQTLAALVIPLSSAVLRKIEDQRAGGDFVLRISARVRVCQSVIRQQEPETLGVPFETYLRSNEYASGVDYKIPQSDWIKNLRALNWSELELVELPAQLAKSSPQLARAFKRFDEALDFYRRGDWEASMSSCRKAFEALIKDTIGKDDVSLGQAAFMTLISEPEKAKLINELVKAFTPFLHLARHEQHPATKIRPEDALFALQITVSTLLYVAK